MDLSALLAAIGGHKWLLVSALVITAIVRLLKSDTPLPFNIVIPARWRGWAAVGLGIAAGVLNAVTSGTPWKTAMLQGVGAALTAILGHELVVEGLRNGREFFVAKGATPGGGAGDAGGGSSSGPSSKGTSSGAAYRVAVEEVRALLPQPAKVVYGWSFATALLVVGLGSISSCAAWGTAKPVVKTVLDDTQLACILANAIFPSKEIAVICKVDAVLVPWLDDLLSSKRAAMKREAEQRAGACLPASSSSATPVKP